MEMVVMTNPNLKGKSGVEAQGIEVTRRRTGMKMRMVGVLSGRDLTTVHVLGTEKGIDIGVAGSTKTRREIEIAKRIETKKKEMGKTERRIETVKGVTMKKIGREIGHGEVEVDRIDIGVRKEKRARKLKTRKERPRNVIEIAGAPSICFIYLNLVLLNAYCI